MTHIEEKGVRRCSGREEDRGQGAGRKGDRKALVQKPRDAAILGWNGGGPEKRGAERLCQRSEGKKKEVEKGTDKGEGKNPGEKEKAEKTCQRLRESWRSFGRKKSKAIRGTGGGQQLRKNPRGISTRKPPEKKKGGIYDVWNHYTDSRGKGRS